MSSHSDELHEIKLALVRIEKALVGDEAMGHVGIVDRVGEHEARLAAIEQSRLEDAAQRRGALWVVTALGAVAGAIGSAVTWLVTTVQNAPKP